MKKNLQKNQYVRKKRFWSKWSKLTQIDFETFSLAQKSRPTAAPDELGHYCPSAANLSVISHYDSQYNIWIYSKPLLVEVK